MPLLCCQRADPARKTPKSLHNQTLPVKNENEVSPISRCLTPRALPAYHARIAARHGHRSAARVQGGGFHDHRKSRLSRRRARNAVSAGDQGLPEGDAPARRQAADPVRGRGGAPVGDHRRDLRDRPRQARHRGPLRHHLRARAHPRQEGQPQAARGGPQDHPAGELLLRAPGRAARPRPRHPLRPQSRRQRPLRRPARRRHHPRPGARAQAADARLREAPRPRARGPARRGSGHQRLRRHQGHAHRRAHLPGHRPGREAHRRGGPLGPGGDRALHPDAGDFPLSGTDQGRGAAARSS